MPEGGKPYSVPDVFAGLQDPQQFKKNVQLGAPPQVAMQWAPLQQGGLGGRPPIGMRPPPPPVQQQPARQRRQQKMTKEQRQQVEIATGLASKFQWATVGAEGAVPFTAFNPQFRQVVGDYGNFVDIKQLDDDELNMLMQQGMQNFEPAQRDKYMPMMVEEARKRIAAQKGEKGNG